MVFLMRGEERKHIALWWLWCIRHGALCEFVGFSDELCIVLLFVMLEGCECCDNQMRLRSGGCVG